LTHDDHQLAAWSGDALGVGAAGLAAAAVVLDRRDPAAA
jgi:hypothetical protein